MYYKLYHPQNVRGLRITIKRHIIIAFKIWTPSIIFMPITMQRSEQNKYLSN